MQSKGWLTIRYFCNEIRNEKPGCRVGELVSFEMKLGFDSHNSRILNDVSTGCNAMSVHDDPIDQLG